MSHAGGLFCGSNIPFYIFIIRLLYKTHSFCYLKHMPDLHLLRANSLFELKQAPADAGNVFRITKNFASVSCRGLLCGSNTSYDVRTGNACCHKKTGCGKLALQAGGPGIA